MSKYLSVLPTSGYRTEEKNNIYLLSHSANSGSFGNCAVLTAVDFN